MITIITICTNNGLVILMRLKSLYTYCDVKIIINSDNVYL